MRPVVALLAIPVIIAGLIPVQMTLDDRTKDQGEHFLYLPDREAFRYLALGNRMLAADGLWIRANIYIHAQYFEGKDWSFLYALYDAMTTLDPEFEEAYVRGYLIMTSVDLNTENGLALLSKGQRNLPGNPLICLNLVLTLLLEEADTESAAAALDTYFSHASEPDALLVRLHEMLQDSSRYNFLALSRRIWHGRLMPAVVQAGELAAALTPGGAPCGITLKQGDRLLVRELRETGLLVVPEVDVELWLPIEATELEASDVPETISGNIYTYVDVPEVGLRLEPSLDAPIILTAYREDEVFLRERRGDWLKVTAARPVPLWLPVAGVELPPRTETVPIWEIAADKLDEIDTRELLYRLDDATRDWQDGTPDPQRLHAEGLLAYPPTPAVGGHLIWDAEKRLFVSDVIEQTRLRSQLRALIRAIDQTTGEPPADVAAVLAAHDRPIPPFLRVTGYDPISGDIDVQLRDPGASP